MAEHNQQDWNEAASRQRMNAWRAVNPPPPRKGRFLLGCIVLMGVVAALVVSDNTWQWRDTLQRLARGEEAPAYRASEWQDARSLRSGFEEELATTTAHVSELGKDGRRDLALYTLLVAAGEDVLSQGGEDMGVLMEELGMDVDWLEELVYYCPVEHAATALPMLAYIFHVERKGMEQPECRRLATAIAFEFARVGKGREDALTLYQFYVGGSRKSQLNTSFSGLPLWRLRVLAERGTDERWGNATTLLWFQRNGSLPAQDYVGVGEILKHNHLSLFGVEVDSRDFWDIYRDAAAEGAGHVYEASGCSTSHNRAHYAATAACANGVPAFVAANDKEAVCMVDVNGKWVSSAPVPEGATCSWCIMEQSHHPDFILLAAALDADRDKTMDSLRLVELGKFHFARGNVPLSHACFREALRLQPLNAEAWLEFRSCGAAAEDLAGLSAALADYPGVVAFLSVGQ